MTRSAANHTSSWAGRMAWLTLVVVLVALTGVSGTAQPGHGLSRVLFSCGPQPDEPDGAPSEDDGTYTRAQR